MSPESTHKLMGVYMEGLILGVKTTSSFTRFARFSYSECGLRLLRSLTHMRVMSSLALATPSIAYARFARSLTCA